MRVGPAEHAVRKRLEFWRSKQASIRKTLRDPHWEDTALVRRADTLRWGTRLLRADRG